MPLLMDSLWPGLVVWAALYVSDYTFTLLCARMYRAGVSDIVVYEGSYELNPFFEKDVDALRRVSPRFVLGLIWGAAMLAAVWWLVRDTWPEGYSFALGAMVLLSLAVHIRHVRNFFLFRRALSGTSIHGRVEYERSLMLQLSAIEFAGFGAIFLVAFVVAQNLFLLGGAVSCLAQAGKHAWLAQRRPGILERAAQHAVAADDRPRHFSE